MSRPWIVGLLIGSGVIASVAMTLLGWPESTPAEVAMLELASLPLQASLALGVWWLSRRMRAPGRRGRVALRVAAGVAGIGLVLVGLAHVTGPRTLVHLGLALVWLALLAALIVVVTHLPRRPVPADTFSPIPDDDEDGDELADPPAQDDSGTTAATAQGAAPVARQQAGSVESGRD